MFLRYLITLPLLASLSVLARAQTPFDVVPGGINPDYYAPHDFEAYVSFRFAGESDWWTSHRVLIKKGEGLTRDGRRARCGNRFVSKLPPNAKTLPPTIRFVELLPVLPPRAPDLVFPTSGSFYFPPETLPPLWETPPTAGIVPYLGGGFWVPPGGISLRCKDKSKNPEDCKPHHPKPPPAVTPEFSSAASFATGLMLLLVIFILYGRQRRWRAAKG